MRRGQIPMSMSLPSLPGVVWGSRRSLIIGFGAMAAEHYRSAELVFGWSFYRQGSRAEAPPPQMNFLKLLSTWFGDPDPRIGTAWEKGERLAKLISQRRTLLVLDGLEPLQNPPGPKKDGFVNLPFRRFLRELGCLQYGALCDFHQTAGW